MEQAGHYYPINSHLADYAVLQLALFDATKESLYLGKARAMGNALTHYLTASGEFLTYAPDPDVGYGISDTIWFGCSATAGLALLRLCERSEEPCRGDAR